GWVGGGGARTRAGHPMGRGDSEPLSAGVRGMCPAQRFTRLLVNVSNAVWIVVIHVASERASKSCVFATVDTYRQFVSIAVIAVSRFAPTVASALPAHPLKPRCAGFASSA